MNYLNQIKNVIERDIVNQRKYDYYKNESLVNTYFEIGKLLVKAQGGKERAKYGNNLIKSWSTKLTNLYGKGYTLSNLKRMRQFYMVFEKGAPVGHQLTWTNIRYILPIKNENKRNYYINMCIKNNLSVRQLISEIKSNSYERLSLADKENIKIISDENNISIKDTLKDPIILYTDKNIDNISEKVLKSIILEKISKEFLELGPGFSFVGSEYKLGKWRADLLFFNYEFNSFVVVELKIRKLIPQDIGQIENYMNYIDNNIKKVFHNKTIGIIICKENNNLVMKYCSNSNIYKTTYKLINTK